MPEIKGDYQGKLKTIKATADAKLETVSAIEAGSAIIGNIDRVATVGQIDHLGTVEHVNRIDDFGTIKNIPQVYDRDYAGYYDFLAESIGLCTSPGINSGTFMPLSVNAGGKLILDTLGTVERVKDIDNVGTVGRLETVGMIEAGTISEVTHVGTIGDITHLGSIANTEFDIGTVGRVIRVDTLGTVGRVNDIDYLGTVGKLETVGMVEAGTISEVGHLGTIGDINHLGSIANTSFDQGSVSDHKREMYGWDESDWEKVRTDTGGKLKTAPATSRKGGVQTVANAGTAIALVASSTPAIGVIVKAEHENLGTVYVGDSTVDDTHGFKLRRDEFISFSCQNAGSVFIDASRNAQKVSALYINY